MIETSLLGSKILITRNSFNPHLLLRQGFYSILRRETGKPSSKKFSIQTGEKRL
jgi:hypothetical protein